MGRFKREEKLRDLHAERERARERQRDAHEQFLAREKADGERWAEEEGARIAKSRLCSAPSGGVVFGTSKLDFSKAEFRRVDGEIRRERQANYPVITTEDWLARKGTPPGANDVSSSSSEHVEKGFAERERVAEKNRRFREAYGSPKNLKQTNLEIQTAAAINAPLAGRGQRIVGICHDEVAFADEMEKTLDYDCTNVHRKLRGRWEMQTAKDILGYDPKREEPVPKPTRLHLLAISLFVFVGVVALWIFLELHGITHLLRG